MFLNQVSSNSFFAKVTVETFLFEKMKKKYVVIDVILEKIEISLQRLSLTMARIVKRTWIY